MLDNMYNSLPELFTETADTIRLKNNSANEILAEDFPFEIKDIIATEECINEHSSVISKGMYSGSYYKNIIAIKAEKIEEDAFVNCDNLKTITVLNPNALIENNAIPNKEGLVLCGIEGSTLEAYANQNSLIFEKVYLFDVSNTEEDSVTQAFILAANILLVYGHGDIIRGSNDAAIDLNLFNYIKKIIILEGITSIGVYNFKTGGNQNTPAIHLPNS
jgi:hypothetical protein